MILLLFSCNSQDPDDGPNCDISILLDQLETNSNSNRYVVDISERTDFYSIIYDNGTTIDLCLEALISFQFQLAEWEVELHFSNDATYIAPSKGDVLIDATINPYGRNPLCAIANVHARRPGRVSISIKGKHGPESDLFHRFETIDSVFEVPILGLYPDYSNEVVVRFHSQEDYIIDIDTLLLETEKITNIDPIIEIKTRDKSRMEPGDFHLISSLSYWSPNIVYMIDHYGEIRWMIDYTNSELLNNLLFDVGVEQLQNGNLYFGDKWTNTIYEVDFLGTILDTWPLTQHTFHHNVQEKSNGNFLVTTNRSESKHNNGKSTKQDYIIEIDRTTKQIIKEWDLKQLLDEDRIALGSWLDETPVDWIHTNAVIYSESDNTIIFSGRHQGVVKVDYDDNVKWILAPHKGWGDNRKNQDCNAFLLTAINAMNQPFKMDVQDGNTNDLAFEWPWFQHAPELLPNGNLILFDNGAERNFGTTSESYSRVVEYTIEESDKTVQQIWQFGKERGESCFADVISDVDYLPNTGNILFCPGMRVFNGTAYRGGRILEIEYTTKEVVFEAYVNSSGLTFHRAERMSLY